MKKSPGSPEQPAGRGVPSGRKGIWGAAAPPPGGVPDTPPPPPASLPGCPVPPSRGSAGRPQPLGAAGNCPLAWGNAGGAASPPASARRVKCGPDGAEGFLQTSVCPAWHPKCRSVRGREVREKNRNKLPAPQVPAAGPGLAGCRRVRSGPAPPPPPPPPGERVLPGGCFWLRRSFGSKP